MVIQDYRCALKICSIFNSFYPNRKFTLRLICRHFSASVTYRSHEGEMNEDNFWDCDVDFVYKVE